jgi:hypothetical protein
VSRIEYIDTLGYAHDLKDEYVVCRASFHTRDEIAYDGRRNQTYPQNASSQHRLFRCIVCTMLIYEVWNPLTGDLIVRQYDPPPGYALEGRVLKKVFRQEYAGRWAPPTPTAEPGRAKPKPKTKPKTTKRRAA